MKKIIIYIFVFVFSYSFSQELNLPIFTQYLADNPFIISPTYAGIGENLRVRANGLTQWVGIENAPDNQALFADFRIANRSGIGLSFFNDSNGNTRQRGAKFSFAHHLILDETSEQYLSLGISYNINSFRIDIENFRTIDGAPVDDPAVLDDRSTVNNNFDVGFLYRYKNAFFSFSANNFLDKDVDLATGIEPLGLLNLQVYSGIIIRGRGNKEIELEPSVFFQSFTSDGRSTTDVNFRYRKLNRLGDYYWFGASYRFLNDQFFTPLNLGPAAGFQKNKFYFGYSYQVTFNDLSSFNSGTHSITIGLNFLQGPSSCSCTN